MALMRTLVAAGLKRGKGSFADIFLLMALTAAALTFTVSMYADLNAREEVALAEIGAGDVYAVDMATNLTDEVAAEVEKLTPITSEEYNESEEGIGYLAKKYHFSNGKVVMPAEAMEDITDLLN